MKDLVGRLSALDPDAGAALKVIAYFDRLVDSHAGLEPIVRGAAVLSGRVARLTVPDRRVLIRVDPDGHRLGDGPPPDAGWPRAGLRSGGALCLERSGPAGPIDAMVLERAVAAVHGVLDRTGEREPREVVLDAAAPVETRLRAARRLGLGETARAVALDGGRARVQAAGTPLTSEERQGIGPVVPVPELPASLAAAKTALRFAATEPDPGPRVVHADELGGLAVLATAVGHDTEPAPDVVALDRALAGAHWVLPTLVAVADSPSLRTAATTLVVHHSTLQERLAHSEALLGWPVRDPRGRLRLQLAIALWRLHRNPE
ncbi:helix-turn-helix domain-containing protein [Amycolatopsis sp. 195334CR]|uniref:helix-turn-helix domain-containing protein n=1 Tax=Amycolatopsis sp. 195334CR TaxID=2814588 RepID=UPI001A8E3998|nr:helix-turn-helix domain-containing protein [Amycolatopsis sp. 195334CR]MBN6041848.1 helix-turn-helix domain-containing protein [Amycolatopsis sp. 195334CR]